MAHALLENDTSSSKSRPTSPTPSSSTPPSKSGAGKALAMQAAGGGGGGGGMGGGSTSSNSSSSGGGSSKDVLIRFEVKDTGIGMDEAGKARLFKAFSQVGAKESGVTGRGEGGKGRECEQEWVGGGLG